VDRRVVGPYGRTHLAHRAGDLAHVEVAIVLRGAHRAHYAAVQVIGEQAQRPLLQRRITAVPEPADRRSA
jgi:hypothetical protein